MIEFSVLDLSPVPPGATPGDALRNTLSLARHAEALRYRRYWVAEHHNMPGIASAAPAVVIGQIAAATQSIRVGSGGIMLPNHAPYVIAEQFGTLASLFPGRIDLGLGRAPGTDMATARALRRDLQSDANEFPQDVQELQFWFSAPEAGQAIRAVPGAGLQVPIWILGSSLFGAQLAAALGLPFAFASHFAPAMMAQALAIYRERFQPSAQLAQAHAMLTVNVICADTDLEARRLFTSAQQSVARLRSGRPGQLPPPLDDPDALDAAIPSGMRPVVDEVLSQSFVGSPETVEHALRRFLAQHRPDELMITGNIFDPAARLRSFELAAQVRDRLAAGL